MSDEGLVTRGPEKARPASFSERFALHGAVGQVAAIEAIDEAALRAEDEAAAAGGDKRLRYGVAREVMATVASGAWEKLADPRHGGRVWSLDVVSPGAAAVRVRLSEVDVPRGVTIVVYSPDEPQRVYGPIDGRGWHGTGRMWTPTTAGERQRIEMYVPAGIEGGSARLAADRVMHIYRDPVREAWLRGPGCQDVACQSAFMTTAKACGGIGFVGANAIYCSGQMIATVANDLTPYWLTANHCLSADADAADSEVYWLYQAATCGGSAPNLTSVLRSTGCTLMSTGTLSDYTLLIVDGAIPGSRAWAGWTSTLPISPTASACIHQALAGPKKIALGSMAGTTNNPCSPSGHLRVNWTGAGTDLGSSGAGIFRTDTQQLYGHLHCGPSACATPNSYDGFGSFPTDYAFISGLLAAGSDDSLENNDSCAAARSMTAGTYTSLVVKSTDEDWYKVTLQAGQTLDATVDLINAYGDIDLALHGSCSSGALAVSGTSNNTEAISATNPGPGALDAYLHVYLYNGGAYPDTRNRYNLTISITAAPPPAAPPNNSCAAATVIGAGATAFTTLSATTDGPAEMRCNFFGSSQIGQDVWYTYTAPACGGMVTVSLCTSGFDTRLAVYAGSSCPTINDTAIACNDDWCGVQSRLTFAATGGQTYLIRVGGYGTATGTGTITITPPTLANDLCAGAITLPGPGLYGVNTCGAGTDGPDDGSACAASGPSRIYNDVWYRYTPECAGPVRVNLCGSSPATFDTRVSVYTGTCPATSGLAIACNDDSCGVQSQAVFAATAGQAYLLRVGSHYVTDTGTISLAVNHAADWDANGAVAPADVALYVNDWLTAIQSGTRRADMDMNGAVDPADVAAFVQAWFAAVGSGC